ncbi:MAG: LysM peptidoglycan-binding domain-containing protein [Bacteroidota bacterium]
MRFKILLIICPLLILTSTAFAKAVFDSVGVENHNGKKVILHKVEPKETYFGVGRRYNIKPNLIIQFNNNIVLQPGAIIKVPTELPFAEVVNKPAPKAESKPEVKQTTQQFKVMAGETLYSIAKRFGTTVDDIKETNGLKSDVLSPGQILLIKSSGGSQTKPAEKETVAETKPVQAPPVVQQTKPQVQPPVSPPQVQANTHTEQTTPVNTQNTQQYKVFNGETLFTIAKRFNTSVDDIIALNKLPNNNITPGQILLVRNGMPPAPVVEPAKQQEVVAKRDTTLVAASDSLNADRHIPANRYGLFLKDEKGPATWMDDPSFDPKKQLVLHRTAPIGTVMKITNPMTGRSVFAKVAGRFADNEANKDVIVVVTKNVADMIGAMDKRFRVNLSYGVPNDQQ